MKPLFLWRSFVSLFLSHTLTRTHTLSLSLSLWDLCEHIQWSIVFPSVLCGSYSHHKDCDILNTANPDYFVRTKYSYARDLWLSVHITFLYSCWPVWSCNVCALIPWIEDNFSTEATTYEIYMKVKCIRNILDLQVPLGTWQVNGISVCVYPVVHRSVDGMTLSFSLQVWK